MYYENNKFKLYYEIYGKNNKDIILILPGWGNTKNTFKYLIDNLKNNYKIYIIDNPPFNNSKIKKEDLSIYDYTKLIIEFMNKEKIIKPIIIAHSFGGRISILLSSKYNIKIKKQILIDIAGIKNNSLLNKIKTKSYKILKRIINKLPKKIKVKLNTYLIKKYSSNDYYSLQNNMKKTFINIINEDLKNYLKDINTNTLLLWGEYDKDTPLKDAYVYRKYIKNSELIVFSKASHYSYLDYPNLTLNIIKEYIK